MTANALAPVFAPDDIKSRNSEASVKAATGEDGALYAFPETDDNGYFLVYDKSIIKNPVPSKVSWKTAEKPARSSSWTRR